MNRDVRRCHVIEPSNTFFAMLFCRFYMHRHCWIVWRTKRVGEWCLCHWYVGYSGAFCYCRVLIIRPRVRDSPSTFLFQSSCRPILCFVRLYRKRTSGKYQSWVKIGYPSMGWRLDRGIVFLRRFSLWNADSVVCLEKKPLRAKSGRGRNPNTFEFTAAIVGAPITSRNTWTTIMQRNGSCTKPLTQQNRKMHSSPAVSPSHRSTPCF